MSISQYFLKLIVLPLSFLGLTACNIKAPTIYQANLENTTQLSVSEAKTNIPVLAHKGTVALHRISNRLLSVQINEGHIAFNVKDAGLIACPIELSKPDVSDFGSFALDFQYVVDFGCGIEIGFYERKQAENLANALYVLQTRTSSAQSTGQVISSSTIQAVTPTIRSDIDELPPSKTNSNPNAYAVIVGIEDYRQKLPQANFAVNDAQAVSNYLTKVLGYPEENVVLLLGDRASNVDLAKYFEKWLPNNVEPGGSVFIYYSGHGAPNPKSGEAYLVPYDGDPSFIEETGYSLQRLYAALGKLPAKQIVVALDSCFSGAGGRSVLADGARPIVIQTKEQLSVPKHLTVLSASSSEQISSTYKEKGHGLFTYFLLKGIKNEDVIGADGALRIDALYAYLKPQVERVARKQYNNEQTPQLFMGNR